MSIYLAYGFAFYKTSYACYFQLVSYLLYIVYTEHIVIVLKDLNIMFYQLSFNPTTAIIYKCIQLQWMSDANLFLRLFLVQIFLSIYLSIYLYICISSFHLIFRLSIYLSIYLYICISSICLSNFLSIYIYIYIFFFSI